METWREKKSPEWEAHYSRMAQQPERVEFPKEMKLSSAIAEEISATLLAISNAARLPPKVVPVKGYDFLDKNPMNFEKFPDGRFTFELTAAPRSPKQIDAADDRIRAILAKLELRNWRYPVRFKLNTLGNIEVGMKCNLRDDESREDCVLAVVAVAPETSEESIISLMRSTIKSTIDHEVDECLHYDGKRRWDPHAGEMQYRYF